MRLAGTEARIVDNREMPDICLQHMVSVMILDKTASFQAAHDKARMKDPAVLRMRAKVQLIPSEELERMEPRTAGHRGDYAERWNRAVRPRHRGARHDGKSDEHAKRSFRNAATWWNPSSVNQAART